MPKYLSETDVTCVYRTSIHYLDCTQNRLMTSKSLYEDLEVTKEANSMDIKQNYKRLALRWHPDKNPGDPVAAKKFMQISQAYQVLIDPTQRRLYDMQDFHDFDFVDLDKSAISPNELFNTFFEHLTESGLFMDSDSLDDLFEGPEMNIAVTTFAHLPRSAQLVAHLNQVTKSSHIEPFVKKVTELFEDKKPQRCGSTDDYSHNKNFKRKKSPDIHVSVWVDLKDLYDREIKKIKLNIIEYNSADDTHLKKIKTFLIPVSDNQIKLSKQADKLKDHMLRGDIVVDVKTRPDSVFQRYPQRGCDLLIVKRISLCEYAFGTTFCFQHLSGRMMRFSYVGFLAQSHQYIPATYRLTNLGLPKSRFSEYNGDLYLKIMIDPSLTEEQQMLLKKHFPSVQNEIGISSDYPSEIESVETVELTPDLLHVSLTV